MLSVKVLGTLAIKEQLALLKLPAQKRKRLLNRALTRGVRVAERRRIKEQRDVNGAAFVPRKHKRPGQKAKMLTGLAKRLVVTKLTADYGVLGFSDRKTGIIATAHNNGQVATGTAAQLANSRNTDPQRAATKQQLRSLKLLNYKIPAGKGRYKRPSAGWLKEHMRFNQAGFLIKLLENTQTKPRSWPIKTPKREFNGISAHEQNQLISQMLGEILNPQSR